MSLFISRPAVVLGTFAIAGIVAFADRGTLGVCRGQVQTADTLAPIGGVGQIGDPNEYLKEQLLLYIRPRLPEERAFINFVVEKVKDETLPARLVNGAMLYARVRRPYPYPYFKMALLKLAERDEIDLGTLPPATTTPNEVPGF